MSAPIRCLPIPLLLVAAMPAALAGQSRADVAVGVPIRVHVSARGEWRQGTLVRADWRYVVLRTGGLSLRGESLVTIQRAAVREVQVRGERRHSRRRTVIGALVGTVALPTAIVLGAAAAPGEEDMGMLIAVPLGAVVGGIIGGVVGARTAPRGWVPATLPPHVGTASRAADRRTLVGAAPH